MQDVSVWTTAGQVTLFFLVAFPVIGTATYAASWLVYCWQQPGVLGVALRRWRKRSEESWQEDLYHDNLDDVLNRARKVGYPDPAQAAQAARKARVGLAKVQSKMDEVGKAEYATLIVDTGITPGYGETSQTFRLKKWYRDAKTGKLMKLQRVDPKNKKSGFFETEGYRGILEEIPATRIRDAQPQNEEWWARIDCATHGQGIPHLLKVESGGLFWKAPMRQVELKCGCMVPSGYGKGSARFEPDTSNQGVH